MFAMSGRRLKLRWRSITGLKGSRRVLGTSDYGGASKMFDFLFWIGFFFLYIVLGMTAMMGFDWIPKRKK